jgi:hypothetical protein
VINKKWSDIKIGFTNLKKTLIYYDIYEYIIIAGKEKKKENHIGMYKKKWAIWIENQAKKSEKIILKKEREWRFISNQW